MLRKFNVNINGKDYVVKLEEIGAPAQPVMPTQQQAAQAAPAPVAQPAAPAPVVPVSGEGTTVESPMPGTILKVLVKVGDAVTANQGLVILEAMKMENEIVAPKNGTVSAVYVTDGSAIDVGKPMITIV